MEPELDDHLSFVSTLDVRSKLTAFMLMLIWSFLFDHPLCHLVLSIWILWAGFNSGMTASRLLGSLKPLLPVLILILIFTAFTDSHTFRNEENGVVLFSVATGIEATRGGVLLGVTFVLRLMNMVMMTKTILACTPLDDFIQLFHKLKLPGSISLVITTAIRFFPELERKKQVIINAQRARGADIGESGNLRGIYARMSLMIPLIINSIIMAEKLSLALLTRGFGYDNHRTDLHELSLKKRDYLVLFICIIGLFAGIGLKNSRPLRVPWTESYVKLFQLIILHFQTIT